MEWNEVFYKLLRTLIIPTSDQTLQKPRCCLNHELLEKEGLSHKIYYAPGVGTVVFG